jgi:zinc/manganese transport system substrate-binding protein
MSVRFLRRRPGAVSVIAAALAATGLALSGCAGAENAAGGSQDRGDGRLGVVASTDVWGSVVSAVGGSAVEVTTIIDDASADPHGYESSPSDAAAVLGADLVVFNGGGYDEFMPQILGSGNGEVPAVEAVAEIGDAHAEGDAHGAGDNEHVWYDLRTVDAVARRVAAELGGLDPARAATFTANAEAFGRQLDSLMAQVSSIRQRHGGTPVAVTEPIAFHLIESAGLADITPPDFVEAVEEETDPPAAAVAETRRLITDRRVAVLVFNPQTRTPVTAQVRTAAEGAGIPVVETTETLPDATGYVDWMSGQIGALEQALQSRAGPA